MYFKRGCSVADSDLRQTRRTAFGLLGHLWHIACTCAASKMSHRQHSRIVVRLHKCHFIASAELGVAKVQHDLLDGELWGISTCRASRLDALLSLKEIVRACVLLCASLKPAKRCACCSCERAHSDRPLKAAVKLPAEAPLCWQKASQLCMQAVRIGLRMGNRSDKGLETCGTGIAIERPVTPSFAVLAFSDTSVD